MSFRRSLCIHIPWLLHWAWKKCRARYYGMWSDHDYDILLHVIIVVFIIHPDFAIFSRQSNVIEY